MVIKLDSDSNPNPLIRYADFLVICHIQNPRDFCGFVVKPDGVYVNMHLDDPMLFPSELAVLSWHPTGRYKEPALALPCTVSEFKNFISEAGLVGCVVEEELSRREWMQQFRDERQSDPASLRNLAEKFEQFGMKIGFKNLADKPLPQTGAFSDAQVQSLVTSRNSALTGIAANCSQVGARADFRKPHKTPQYVPDGIDPSETTKTITVKYVPMDGYRREETSDSRNCGIPPSWELKKPKRPQGYGPQLNVFLKTELDAGKPIPKPLDLLKAWKIRKPDGISAVEDDGFIYPDALGKEKKVDLEAILKAIRRATVTLDNSDDSDD